MINQYIRVDWLAIIMLAVVWLGGLVVGVYAYHYMRLERHYKQFMLYLVSLIISISIFFMSNNVIMSVLTWTGANLFLVNLMGSKTRWLAAKASARLAFLNLMSGSALFAISIGMLAYAAASLQIDVITNAANLNPVIVVIAMSCLIIAAMLQAALWPFNSWLISSLNSPTPVSAVMHAGLVNGGGYLLLRFSNICMHMPIMMHVIFIFGCISAVLGSAIKLVQSDVKRQLACSTMSQMGFMTMLVGLGLLPIALTHLVLHAFFKANLFLGFNNSLFERKLRIAKSLKLREWIACVVFSLIGFSLFYLGFNHRPALDSWSFIGVFLACVVFQLVMMSYARVVEHKNIFILAVLISSWLYGWYVGLVEKILLPHVYIIPVDFDNLHIAALAVMTAVWLVFVFRYSLNQFGWCKSMRNYLYVRLLNAGQPDPETVTVSRQSYNFQ